MRTPLLLAVLFCACSLLRAEEAAAPALDAKDVKVKVRWTEKKDKDGHRVVTVFLKNDGFADLKDMNASIILRGQGDKEQQTAKVTISLLKNREDQIEIPVTQGETGGFVGIVGAEPKTKPLGKMKTVELTMGGLSFASN